jgi:DNA polymerase eta
MCSHFRLEEDADVPEKASIDEAFLDLTLMVFERLLIRFPYLATIPEGTTLDTPLPSPPPIDWSKAGTILPVPGEDEKAAEDTADTEAQVEAGTYQDTWEDWALCLGAELMAELRAEVYDKLRYTCSAGISHGKAMAKVCQPFQSSAQIGLTPSFLPGTRNPTIRPF